MYKNKITRLQKGLFATVVLAMAVSCTFTSSVKAENIENETDSIVEETEETMETPETTVSPDDDKVRFERAKGTASYCFGTRHDYGPDGEVISYIRSDFDEDGRLLKKGEVRVYDGKAFAFALKDEYQFDEDGRIILEFHTFPVSDGELYLYTYNESDQIVSDIYRILNLEDLTFLLYGPSEDCQYKYEMQHTYTYDENGYLTTIERINEGGEQNYEITEFVYDENNCLQYKNTYYTDGNGNRLTYDEHGNVIKNEMLDNVVKYTFENVYDENGNLIRSTHRDIINASFSQPDDYVREYEYDSENRMIKETRYNIIGDSVSETPEYQIFYEYGSIDQD